jgi:sec-independent protein translocase protein TatB
MFDLSWSHILVVMVVAIVVIGPKDLPRVLRAVGRWTGKVKRMAREFQDQFNEALREAELDTMQKEVEELTKVDLSDVNAELAKTNTDIMTKLNTSTGEPTAPPSAAVSAEAEPASVSAVETAPVNDPPPAAALAAEAPPVEGKEPVVAEAKP